jgi:hypothetical protein
MAAISAELEKGGISYEDILTQDPVSDYERVWLELKTLL